MKPKPTPKKPLPPPLDVTSLTVADIQNIMDVNEDHTKCLAAIFDKLNPFDSSCGRYYMRWQDLTVPSDHESYESEDIVHIFDRGGGEFWIRF